MNKKETKKQGLKAESKRQAHDSLRGYLYQIWHSVSAWLELGKDEILYLEGAEDFDKVSNGSATATQVKDTQHKITLRSQEVNDAINYYWELRNNHPDMCVKFRFLTRSKIGRERGNPFGEDQAGLHLWTRCSGDEAVITKVSKFLQVEGKISENIDDFLKQAEPERIYEELIEPITWETNSKGASFVEKAISEKLILHGDRYNVSPSYSSKVVDHLLKEAFIVATQGKNRELTRARFLEIFEEKTTQRVPIQDLKYMQIQSTTMDIVGSAFIESPSDITIQSQSPIQTNMPPLYPDFAPRIDLVTNIQNKLQSEGLAVIRGGTGMGKTTLAKLTANAMNGSWFWLNFTEREPLQITQLLQQLFIAMSNKSSPVSIVLDALNLQPQKLQQYEDVLGAVVYRVIESGAKLLITSQYNLPNSFIRRLGISKSVVFRVTNFTIHEIEQFAQQLECPANDIKTWAKLILLHTSGHPRLVHAYLVQLRMKDWKKDENESIFQIPRGVIEEREEARQLLVGLSEDQQELLYRLSLISIEFRRDYALNIGEIPKPISRPGDTFSQLIGPWIDPTRETYYTVSPLLNNAAKQVWSESKINDLHAQIANAILKTKNLTTIEAWSVLLHSIFGKNKESLVTILQALLVTPKDNWKKLSQDFSWLIHVKTNLPEELFPRDGLVNLFFRSLQYRIAVEAEPDFAPKILELWDKETKLYKLHKSYLMSRIIMMIQALLYYQVSLPVKQKIGYIKEIIDNEDSCEEIQELYNIFKGQLGEYMTDKPNFLSVLFILILAPRPIYSPYLDDLIDALDELQPKIRTLLLASFEDDITYFQLLLDNVWLSEADLENPDWTRCLQTYDKVIEKTIVWGYPHIASAAARGKAIIQDEYLHDPNAAHISLQDITSKMGPSSIIEEAHAVVYLHCKHYREALSIYERILPQWNPLSELDFGPLDGYRRAAICAAYLDYWEKAATFFEDGAKRAQQIDETEQYIGLYADAGFAQFKAGNMLDSMNLFTLALQEFDKLPQDNTNVKYFTLKKRLGHTTTWLSLQIKNNNSIEDAVEPSPGCCSDPEANEKILTLPDFPIGFCWLYISQIEYKFGLGTTAFQHTWNITDRDAYPPLKLFLLFLKIQYDFKNKNFNDIPHHIYQLAYAHASVQKHNQNGKKIGEKGVYSISTSDLSNFASTENIANILIAALLVQLSKDININEILSTWRMNSVELPIKENMTIVLDLVESMLLRDEREVSTVMKAQESKEKRLVAALKTIHNIDADPTDLFYAHTLVTTVVVDNDKLWGWEEHIMLDLAELFSRQWLEKIKFQALLKTPRTTVPEIEQACNSGEAGKKKIARILLAASQAVSVKVSSYILQDFRSWIEDMTIPEPIIKFTYEDYLNTPEDKRYELLDGELVMAPAPGELHQSVSAQLGWRLVQFVSENSLGKVYQAPFDVVLSNMNVVQPDLLFVSSERGHIITPANIQGAPDLVVEILSPSTAERDRAFKNTLYAKYGVNEYWMVDTTAKDITVLLLGEREYEVVGTYGEGETLTSPTLQGFTLNIGNLF